MVEAAELGARHVAALARRAGDRRAVPRVRTRARWTVSGTERHVQVSFESIDRESNVLVDASGQPRRREEAGAAVDAMKLTRRGVWETQGGRPRKGRGHAQREPTASEACRTAPRRAPTRARTTRSRARRSGRRCPCSKDRACHRRRGSATSGPSPVAARLAAAGGGPAAGPASEGATRAGSEQHIELKCMPEEAPRWSATPLSRARLMSVWPWRVSILWAPLYRGGTAEKRFRH